MSETTNPAVGAFRAELERFRQTAAGLGANPTEVRIFNLLLDARVLSRRAANLPVSPEERARLREEVCAAGRSMAASLREGIRRPGSERFVLELLYDEFQDLPAQKSAILGDLIDLNRREPLTGAGAAPAAPAAAPAPAPAPAPVKAAGTGKTEKPKKGLLIGLIAALGAETLVLLGLLAWLIFFRAPAPAGGPILLPDTSAEAGLRAEAVPTPTPTENYVWVVTATPTASPILTSESKSTPTPTPSPTPTPTPSPRPRNTPTPTPSPRPRNTPTPTPTATPDLPLYNGKVFVEPSYRRDDCVITVTASTDKAYYIHLRYLHAPADSFTQRELLPDAATPPEDDIAFYVSRGATAEVKVPVGVYEVYFCSGPLFMSKALKFGAATEYGKAKEPITFYTQKVDEFTYSHSRITIVFEKTEDGNMKTDSIPAFAFPG